MSVQFRKPAASPFTLLGAFINICVFRRFYCLLLCQSVVRCLWLLFIHLFFVVCLFNYPIYSLICISYLFKYLAIYLHYSTLREREPCKNSTPEAERDIVERPRAAHVPDPPVSWPERPAFEKCSCLLFCSCWGLAWGKSIILLLF